jgi:hypothetical protein
MSLELRFSGSKIEGHGFDPVGRFLIAGQYNQSDELRMLKTYVTHQVRYHGASEGEGISGEWCIPDLAKGPFRVWPIGDDTMHKS